MRFLIAVWKLFCLLWSKVRNAVSFDCSGASATNVKSADILCSGVQSRMRREPVSHRSCMRGRSSRCLHGRQAGIGPRARRRRSCTAARPCGRCARRHLVTRSTPYGLRKLEHADVARQFGNGSNKWTDVLGHLARGWPMAAMMLSDAVGIPTERLVEIADTLCELGLARRLPIGDEPWFGVTKVGVRLHRDQLSSASRGGDCGERISRREVRGPQESVGHDGPSGATKSLGLSQKLQLLAMLRVLWVKPTDAENQWKLIHPHANGPLSVHASQDLARRAAADLLGKAEGGTIVLLKADGGVLCEESVAPEAAESESVLLGSFSVDLTLTGSSERSLRHKMAVAEVRRQLSLPSAGRWIAQRQLCCGYKGKVVVNPLTSGWRRLAAECLARLHSRRLSGGGRWYGAQSRFRLVRYARRRWSNCLGRVVRMAQRRDWLTFFSDAHFRVLSMLKDQCATETDALARALGVRLERAQRLLDECSSLGMVKQERLREDDSYPWAWLTWAGARALERHRLAALIESRFGLVYFT